LAVRLVTACSRLLGSACTGGRGMRSRYSACPGRRTTCDPFAETIRCRRSSCNLAGFGRDRPFGETACHVHWRAVGHSGWRRCWASRHDPVATTFGKAGVSTVYVDAVVPAFRSDWKARISSTLVQKTCGDPTSFRRIDGHELMCAGKGEQALRVCKRARDETCPGGPFPKCGRGRFTTTGGTCGKRSVTITF